MVVLLGVAVVLMTAGVQMGRKSFLFNSLVNGKIKQQPRTISLLNIHGQE